MFGLSFLDDLPVRVAFMVALHGVVLLIVGSLALVMGARLSVSSGYQGPRWRWFGWFAMLKGLAVVGSLTLGSAYGWRPMSFYTAVYVGINLVAWLAGAQFVWSSWKGWLPRTTGWAPVVVWGLAVALTALVEGWQGMVLLHTLMSGLVGLAVLGTLFVEARALERKGTLLNAVSLMLVVAGLGGLIAMEWLGVRYYGQMQGWTMNTMHLYAQREFGLMATGTGFAWALGIGWWVWMRGHVAQMRGRGWLKYSLWVLPPGLLIIFTVGFMVINRTKIQGNERVDRLIQTRGANIALGLKLAGYPGDDPATATRALVALAKANPDIETIALIKVVDEKIVPIFSTNPEVPLPEQVVSWREQNAIDRQFIESTTPFSSAFMQDSYGGFTLYCEPIAVPGGNGWLAMRISYYNWGEVMGPVIAQVTFIVLLMVIGVIAMVVFLIQREVAGEVRINFERADASSRAKTELLTRASHELRTPIQGVLGYTDLLERTPLEPRQRGWVEALRTQGTHLLRLVNDLLDFGALQSGRIRFEDMPVSPAAVAAEALAVVRPQAEINGLQCVLSVDRSVPAWVTGDATRLRQIMVNLLGNAVKFTEKGCVSLVVSSRPEIDLDNRANLQRLSFAVEDTGPGIATADMASLFEASARTRRHPAEGAGLGLALTRSLCAAMGGDLQVESVVGRGSTFTASVVLPVAEAPVTSETGSRPLPLLTQRVLVVEDNTPLRLMMGAWLDQLGCGSVLVGDGETALEKMKIEHFDAVVLDLGLPGIDGHEVARRLCATSRTNGRPWIVGLSAHAGDADRAAALEAGMDRFMSKPVGLNDLAEALQRGVPVLPPARGMLSSRLLNTTQVEAVWTAALQETPVRLAALQMAVEAEDWNRVAAMAHYLCNTADVLGAEALHDACLACEVAAKTGDYDAVRTLTITIGRLGSELPAR